jgi:type II secretory ATPase GspE/PulE/Tfp pilus assembly ATPase PilB-like protein
MADAILNGIAQVQELANQLVLVVGPAGSGKTWALREVAQRATYP